MQWENLFAARTSAMKRNTIREFLKLANKPGMISFAGGLPAKELLPVEAVADCVATVMKRAGSAALQYGETQGVAELREWVAASLSSDLDKDNIVIVSGAQQALDLVGRVLLDRNDAVAVENPTYLAALSAWHPLGAKLLGIKGDEHGMDITALESTLRTKPKFVYVVPNFQNPQGTTLALPRRKRMIELLKVHDVPLIEDDPYRELRYEGDDLPSVLTLQPDAPSGRVLYIGTVSKSLAPGFRIGWIAGPKPVIDKLVLAKQSMDLHTSTFNQYVVLELLRRADFSDQLLRLQQAYRERRNAMLQALDEYFPRAITWSRPEGGMFVLARLPEGIAAKDLLPKAIDQKVMFVPGDDFHVDGGGQNTFRLNFTRHQPNEIREGISRLGQVISREI
jgi:2-aminoadipate transaminase